MKFWLVKGKDGKVYLTQDDNMPVRRGDRSTGWNMGWPGTAYIDDYVQMYGLFAVFYKEARDVINKANFPQRYEDNPVEIELEFKMHWYD